MCSATTLGNDGEEDGIKRYAQLCPVSRRGALCPYASCGCAVLRYVASHVAYRTQDMATPTRLICELLPQAIRMTGRRQRRTARRIQQGVASSRLDGARRSSQALLCGAVLVEGLEHGVIYNRVLRNGQAVNVLDVHVSKDLGV